MSRAPWKPDIDIAECPICKARFGFFRRKDHCRACGDIFCKSCLPRKIPCTGYTQPEVACMKCILEHDNNKSTSANTANPVADSKGGNSGKQQGSSSNNNQIDLQRVQELCKSFEPKLMTTSANITKAAKLMVDQAQAIVPAPFNGVCTVASTLLSLAVNSVVNTAESCRLADRVGRLSFAMLQLSINPGEFAGASLVATQLLKVFEDAVKLLEQFQPASSGKRSFMETIKSKMTIYSSGTVDQFNAIHAQLTLIMQDRAFMVSVSKDEQVMALMVSSPTLEQIQQSLQQELSQVVNEIKKTSQEGANRLDHIEAQLEGVLSALNNSLPSHMRNNDVAILNPWSLRINTATVLGQGASGKVYSGTLFGSIDVAVKVLMNAPASESALQEMTHELERTIRVAHRNVIKIYGMILHCSEFDGRPAVVMEQLGESLDSVVTASGGSAATKPSAASLMKLTTDIIAGMARVHDVEDGVVHFDLKPGNILLTKDGRTAKIIDFGIAQSKTTVAFSSAVDKANARGTVAFMAPEILLGTSRGFPCDVYSFAVLLYSLWSGRQPWQGFTDNSIITAVQQGSRPATDVEMITQGIPEPIVALIVACWDQSPGNRPSFKSMLALREIDSFWEAPVSKWPVFLQEISQSLGSMSMQSGSSGLSSPSAGPSYGSSVATGASSASGKGLAGVGGGAVSSFNCEQLCSWLLDTQSIDDSVVDWMREKKITGDIFVASGAKVIDKLRKVESIDEWHVDALERCHQRTAAAVDAEKERLQKLQEARDAVAQAARQKQLEEETAKAEAAEAQRRAQLAEEKRKQEQVAAEKARADAIAAAKREAETKRQLELAKVAEYDRCKKLNLQALERWRQMYASMDPKNAEPFYRDHVSPSYTSSITYPNSTGATYSTYEQAKAKTIENLKGTFTMPAFKVTEVTDTTGSIHYTFRWPNNVMWTADAKFHFNPPGKMIRGEYHSRPGDK